MNVYKSLNEVIEYIETNLEEEIAYTKLAQILGVNEYTMQSVFSLLCNISLSEYIRKRRLSNAGYDLSQTNEKVMEIAIKYQYDNATSFSRAFEKFHGIKPSSVKKQPEGLKVFAKIHFDEQQEIAKPSMKYSIIETEELVLYGEEKKTTTEKIGEDAPKHFQEVIKKYAKAYGYPNYGMVVYQDRFQDIVNGYWVLYDKKIPELKKYIIPKSKWLVFHIPNENPKDIQEVSHRFCDEFVPSCKYNLREIPELEYYHDGMTEFMVPIED